MPRIPSADRRALLVQAAIRVIAEHGVAGATTRAIVGEAGMSLASFHYAFRSHAELMHDVVTHVVDAEVGSVFASLRLGSDIRSTIRAGLQAYLDYVVADPAHELALQELNQYALRMPGLQRLAAEQYAAYHTGVAAVLVEGAAVSNVEWTRPVPDIARLVVTTTDGVTLAWLVDRDTAAAERVLDFAADSLAALAVPLTRSV
jgi:TetR/AcrR family transcriptional regulator, regulator of biofilm formation and stress response